MTASVLVRLESCAADDIDEQAVLILKATTRWQTME
jgi:hypothetical protein